MKSTLLTFSLVLLGACVALAETYLVQTPDDRPHATSVTPGDTVVVLSTQERYRAEGGNWVVDEPQSALADNPVLSWDGGNYTLSFNGTTMQLMWAVPGGGVSFGLDGEEPTLIFDGKIVADQISGLISGDAEIDAGAVTSGSFPGERLSWFGTAIEDNPGDIISNNVPVNTPYWIRWISEVSNGTGNLTYTNATVTRAELGVPNEYALLADVKGSGTNGGTFTSGAWQTRNLTTEVHDSAGIVTLNATTGNFTLGNGTYRIAASAPALFVSSHQARLFNVTGNSVVAYGTSEYSNTADAQTRSFVDTVVAITSGPTVFRLEHRCFTTRSNTGFGGNVGFGGDEIYSTVRIERLR